MTSRRNIRFSKNKENVCNNQIKCWKWRNLLSRVNKKSRENWKVLTVATNARKRKLVLFEPPMVLQPGLRWKVLLWNCQFEAAFIATSVQLNIWNSTDRLNLTPNHVIRQQCWYIMPNIFFFFLFCFCFLNFCFLHLILKCILGSKRNEKIDFSWHFFKSFFYIFFKNIDRCKLFYLVTYTIKKKIRT